MFSRRSPLGFLMPALVVVLLSGAAVADKRVEVTAASAPAGTDARLKAALSASIEAQLEQTGLAAKLSGFSISPALIQMRRFIEPGQRRVRTVCLVELGLHDGERGLVANVRGNAASFEATQLDVLEAAAHAAVDRLPAALAALPGPRGGARVAGR